MHKIFTLLRFSIPLFLGLILTLFIIAGVAANHFVYLGEDSGQQPGGTKANFTFGRWYTGAFLPGDPYYDLHWAAQNATVKGYMDSAIAAWKAQDDALDIDWHGWKYEPGWPQSWVNIRVYEGACPGAPTARACWKRQTWDSMGTQNAQFWFQADLYLRTTTNPGTTTVPNFFSASILSFNNVGVHQTIENRTFSFSKDVRSP